MPDWDNHSRPLVNSRSLFGEDPPLPIDLLFAERLLPQGPPSASHFLAFLSQSAREGNLCFPLTADLDPQILEGAALLPPSLFDEYLVKECNAIYLRRNWECEQKFLRHLNRIAHRSPTIPIDCAQLNTAKLNEEQKGALFKASRQTLTLITGGPGSGKTHTAAVLINAFMEQGVTEVAVAAPTGKATAHLKNALGSIGEKCTIKTLHSLLKHPKLFADLIVIDEGSMVDAEWMATLFAAVNDGARLILLGDTDQLPPLNRDIFLLIWRNKRLSLHR